MSWGRWWWMSSPPAWWVSAGVVCLPCVGAVSWCVNCAAGPAALSSCCLLSLAVSAALRPSPSCSIPFPSGSRISSLTPATPLRVTMTAMVTMVTVRLRVVCAVLVPALSCYCCNSVCVTAAGSAGHVSGDADAVVVPVDVPCAPSDGSPSYRVFLCACVWAWKKCSAAGAEADCENYTFSGFDVRMHSRNGELGAVCHVANAVHTCSNCAASCATEEEGATVAFTMNVTTHKYAGPYELWWRQFSPDGTIHPPARSGDADQTGICQLPPPREGRDDTKPGGTTAPQVNAEPSRQNEDWRQSAAADGPNTVVQSPASNTATNTSETRPEFATNPSEMMVPNASTKRPSFANGPRILVASNASGIMSVTYGGREHVAADNTYEVSERNATRHKSPFLRKWRCGQWICC
ncbi:hypothetical protein Tc00.1047053510279.100 [Trypanosoma cruzi]|uniref:Mucin-like glycoprotein n=1 Tax=Trypanosoma cruzi (strain CL Brener) TaxID=353153 RepID=Q4E384_TRYCC|nr:hypothetical protein Tc00.1047053510279.100 [Trypanosoma cruzi]EAN99226.1 hypothetical protein Tc00.1047053510279.100 [Trypanosoma cruzi]|eukprot:XP_821077.1 hypothetical protein [Trypanosoma cruzi strain CL Brener]